MRTTLARMSIAMRLGPLCIVLLLVCGTVTSTGAQERPWTMAAGMSGALLISPTVPLQIQGLPTPPVTSFSSTAEGLPSFFVDGTMGLTSTLDVGIRLAITPGTIRSTAQERLPIAVNNNVVLASINHVRDVSTTLVAAEAFLRIPIHGIFRADVAAGATLPLAVRAVQRQRLVDPPGLRLPDGSIEQQTGAGTVQASAVPSVALRLLASLAIGDALALEPGLGFRQVLASIGSGDGWAPLMVDAGLSLRINLSRPTPRGVLPVLLDTTPAVSPPVAVDTIVVNDTVTVAALGGTGSVVLDRQSIQQDGSVIRVTNRWKRTLPLPEAVLEASVRVRIGDRTDVQDAALKVVRIERIRTISVVPAIMFLEGTDKLRSEYNVASPGRPALFAVPEELAARARQAPMTVQLVGWHDGSTTRMALAERRLRAVRAMLGRLGRGSTIRIEGLLKVTDQPALWSVVGLSGDAERIKDVTIRDTITETALPTILIEPDVVSDAGVVRWQCIATVSTDTVRVFRDGGAVPARLEWNMAENLSTQGILGQPIRIVMEVQDVDGRLAISDPAVVRVMAAGPLASVQPALQRTEAVRVITGPASTDGTSPAATLSGIHAIEALSGGDAQIAALLQTVWGGSVRVSTTVNEERRP